MLSNPKYIKDWKELKEEKSPTHILEIDEDGGCGYILSSEDEEFKYYLSTHTFYSGVNEHSTKVLQACGFNVVLANWDEIGY